MSTKYREDPFVTCPYYRKEAAQQIRCVGVIPVTVHCTHEWDDASGKDSFKAGHCMTAFESCPHYRAVARIGR